MVLGLNGVAVRSYRLILWENEATSLKIISRCLWTTGDFIINSKLRKKTQNLKT
jgi:hypothetical protein